VVADALKPASEGFCFPPPQHQNPRLSKDDEGEEIAEVEFPTALAKNTVQGEHANKASTKVGGRP